MIRHESGQTEPESSPSGGRKGTTDDESARLGEEAVTLGRSLATMATAGFGAPPVEAAYSRARELSQQIGDTPGRFPALFGKWSPPDPGGVGRLLTRLTSPGAIQGASGDRRRLPAKPDAAIDPIGLRARLEPGHALGSE